MTQSDDADRACIYVDDIPRGHLVLGHVSVLKVLAEDGALYWATRIEELNDMEAYGMLHNAVRAATHDLQGGAFSP